MKRQQHSDSYLLVTRLGKRDTSSIGRRHKSIKTLTDLPETIQLYSVLLKMLFNWNWVKGTTFRHERTTPHHPGHWEKSCNDLIECAERREDTEGGNIIRKSQYHRSHHYLAVSLSLILDEAMTLDVVQCSHESVVPLTLKEYR